MTLVADAGGHSLTYDVAPSFLSQGLPAVTSEHGTLRLDPAKEYKTLP